MARQGDALVGLIEAELAQSPPLDARILDAACGIGTQTLALAARGFRLVARDLSPAAVARLQREANARRLLVEAAVADMRQVGSRRICSPTTTSARPSGSFWDRSARAGCSCARSATTTNFSVASLRPTRMVYASIMGSDFGCGS